MTEVIRTRKEEALILAKQMNSELEKLRSNPIHILPGTDIRDEANSGFVYYVTNLLSKEEAIKRLVAEYGFTLKEIQE